MEFPLPPLTEQILCPTIKEDEPKSSGLRLMLAVDELIVQFLATKSNTVMYEESGYFKPNLQPYEIQISLDKAH